jgi:hypothetical protein
VVAKVDGESKPPWLVLNRKERKERKGGARLLTSRFNSQLSTFTQRVLTRAPERRSIATMLAGFDAALSRQSAAFLLQVE